MHVGIQMPGVGPPIIGGVADEPEGLQQRFKLQKDLIFAATKDIGQDLAGVVIDGMPWICSHDTGHMWEEISPHFLSAVTFKIICHIFRIICRSSSIPLAST